MKRMTVIDKLTSSPEGMRLFQQERAILDVTEIVCRLMDKQHVSRLDLAQRLGKSKGYVTLFLGGRVNMTVRTISDVFTALDRGVYFQAKPLKP